MTTIADKGSAGTITAYATATATVAASPFNLPSTSTSQNPSPGATAGIILGTVILLSFIAFFAWFVLLRKDTAKVTKWQDGKVERDPEPLHDSSRITKSLRK
jgi:drug/metabolite transporter (DMT)-like permease